jgi:cell division protein FtsW (lipid II flippase)
MKKLTTIVFAWAIFVSAFGILSQMNKTLWSRVPADIGYRFAVDRVGLAEQPSTTLKHLVQAYCPEKFGWRPSLGNERAAQTSKLQDCLNQGLVKTPSEEIQTKLRAHVVKQLEQQILTATARSEEWEKILPKEQTGKDDALDDWLRNKALIERANAMLRNPNAELLAQGLAANGLLKFTDYGETPPKVVLLADRNTLAFEHRVVTTTADFVKEGFDLTRYELLVKTVLQSSAFALLLLTLAGRCSIIFSGSLILLAIGSLQLLDLALTGPSELRYLPWRQYFVFMGIPLTATTKIAGNKISFFWPPTAAALAILALAWFNYKLEASQKKFRANALIARFTSFLNGSSYGKNVTIVCASLVLGAGLAWVLPGMKAALSEVLIFIACLALAWFTATQAAQANAGLGVQKGPFLSVVLGLAAVLLVCALRADLGHAVVAVGLGIVFLFHFSGLWVRAIIASCAAIVGVGLFAIHAPNDNMADWASNSLNFLPPYVADRFTALADPFSTDSSDLARVSWLAHSAGGTGWGFGWVPWLGLDPQGRSGFPIQGPSDYVFGITSAISGRWVATLIFAAVFSVFAGAGLWAMNLALQRGRSSVNRFFLAIGGYGCLAMAIKAALSMGGVALVIPLTGLPVALLGYGPVSMIAALIYLAVVIGSCQLSKAHAPVTVARTLKNDPQSAPVRKQMLLTTSVLSAALIALPAIVAFKFVRTTELPIEHHAHARNTLNAALGNALTNNVIEEFPSSCIAIKNIVQEWNNELLKIPKLEGALPLQLDLENFENYITAEGARKPGCKKLARFLGQKLQSEASRSGSVFNAKVETAKPVSGATANDDRRSISEKNEIRLTNPWWGIPGCLRTNDGTIVTLVGNSACAANNNEPLAATTLLSDGWLRRDLGAPLASALHIVDSKFEFHGRQIDKGKDAQLSLNKDWQTTAQLISDCYAGLKRGASCNSVAPVDEKAKLQFFDVSRIRASAIGLVLVEVTSGQVQAMSGSISDCAVQAMNREGEPASSSSGQVLKKQSPALLNGSQCSQFPDKRSAYLLTQHPTSWSVSPGSSYKPLALLAESSTNSVPHKPDTWLEILARSKDQLAVQKAAIASYPKLHDLWRGAGFDGQPINLIVHQVSIKDKVSDHRFQTPKWNMRIGEGLNQMPTPSSLDSEALSFASVLSMRSEKEAGINIDDKYDKAIVKSYLRNRLVMDGAIGGADIRTSALGLANTYRQVKALALNEAINNNIHLARILELSSPSIEAVSALAKVASPLDAQRTLQAMSGVTASKHGGTASGSCRKVFGSCPSSGLPDLQGKTGTGDFLSQENGEFVKPGLQLPAKLFVATFSAGGKDYVVASMALRVRAGNTKTLELNDSAAAEAALTLVRQMRSTK